VVRFDFLRIEAIGIECPKLVINNILLASLIFTHCIIVVIVLFFLFV